MRSDSVNKGASQAPHRSLFNALGYTKEEFGVYNNLPAIIFDDFTTDKKYVNFPFKIKSSAIKILRAKQGNDIKFGFELISNIN